MDEQRTEISEAHRGSTRDHFEVCDFRALTNRLPIALACYVRCCMPIYANLAYIELAGGTLGDLPSAPWLTRSNAPKWLDALLSTSKFGTPCSFEARCEINKGEIRWYSVRMMPGANEYSLANSVLAIVCDISNEKLELESMAADESFFRTLVENSPDSIVRYDRACRRRYINPSLEAAVGMSQQEWLGRTPSECPGGIAMLKYEERLREVIEHGNGTNVELRFSSDAGTQIYHLIRMSPEKDHDGNVVSVLAVGRDVTHIARSRDQMYTLAYIDPMTGLPNRQRFNHVLHDAVSESLHGCAVHGLMLLDLDRFKNVNDTLGHAIGDMLIREVAHRLRAALRVEDTVARLGGDEFAILLPRVGDTNNLTFLAKKLLSTFDAPFILNGREVFTSTSIGITTFPIDNKSETDLLQHADAAMYCAKSKGRGQFAFYSSELTAQAAERLELESLLRGAIKRRELELFYQPKVCLSTGEIIGAEALLRWRSPSHGLLMPSRFIDIAEDTGLIADIGAWAIRSASLVALHLNQARKFPLRIAVNASAKQFKMNRIATVMRDTLVETGCAPEWLELEITEQLLLEDCIDIQEALKMIASLGIMLTIDDFGTRHAALAYLKRIPVRCIKIDRSFVHDIVTDPHSATLVSAIISLASALNLEVVAEGIETHEQEHMIRSYGCEVAQGYLYAMPLPLSEFEELLAAHR
ncbi:putative bifunctional diguanylate cyclase/phosphodiesterase [Burkholderia sp. PU8-34]